MSGDGIKIVMGANPSLKAKEMEMQALQRKSCQFPLFSIE
jgi:hypothetical protein